ncbi:MAG: hypothetical protein IJF79_07720, partial [Clostridia bacterium]|nr:hypothetical protein [Clostridia bacterium]
VGLDLSYHKLERFGEHRQILVRSLTVTTPMSIRPLVNWKLATRLMSQALSTGMRASIPTSQRSLQSKITYKTIQVVIFTGGHLFFFVKLCYNDEKCEGGVPLAKEDCTHKRNGAHL